MRMRPHFLALILVTLFARGAVLANTITVNWALDNDTPNDGRCSLREAVQSAQNDNPSQSNKDCAPGEGADEIVFDTSGFRPGAEDVVLDTQVFLSSDLTIRGPVKIRSAGSERLFQIGGSFDIALRELELEDGFEEGAGGAILITAPSARLDIYKCNLRNNNAFSQGGAISSANALVTISNSEFNANASATNGGALSGSNMAIEDSLFDSNSANLGGGAIFCASGSATQPVRITRSFFAANTASGLPSNGSQTGGGGAIMSNCHLEILESEFLANMAFGVVGGGAILHGSAGVASITRTAFQINSAGFDPNGEGAGGAILARGEILLDRTVFNDNVARGPKGGGAIYFENSKGSKVVNTSLMRNIAQLDPNHNLVTPPQMPSSGGGIGIWGNSELELIHVSLVGNFGSSEISYEFANTPGEVLVKNSLVEGHTVPTLCEGNAIMGYFYGADTALSGGNLQSASQGMPSCPGFTEGKIQSTAELDDFGFGAQTPAGKIEFDYPLPAYFSDALDQATEDFCAEEVVGQLDLLDNPRFYPCDIGAVEIPTQ